MARWKWDIAIIVSGNKLCIISMYTVTNVQFTTPITSDITDIMGFFFVDNADLIVKPKADNNNIIDMVQSMQESMNI